jgi:hypothetical protein
MAAWSAAMNWPQALSNTLPRWMKKAKPKAS